MLDFSESIYNRILRIGVENNIIASCREYPFFSLNQKGLQFDKLKNNLQKKFKNRSFPVGLYINIPFCQSRCSFCKYYSALLKTPRDLDIYLKCLEEELKIYQIKFSNVILKNISIGGGTPSLLNKKQIAQLAKIIHRFFRIGKETQVSIEATPETISKNVLDAWKEFGINRIAFGMPSANDEVLRKIGRHHSARDVFKAFEMVRKAGIEIIGIDVVLGLPGESIRTYKKTINDVIKLSPDHIDAYLLTLGRRVMINQINKHDLDIAIDSFKKILPQNGFICYQQANFLKFVKKGVPIEKAANQNMRGVYSHNVNCLGIGAGASSHFLDLKYNIISNAQTYIQNLTRKLPPPFYGYYLSRDDGKRDYIISHIGYYRCLNKEDYQNLFHSSINSDFPSEINYLKSKKIISEDEKQLSWHLKEKELGHQDFFLHSLKYWYNPKRIKELLKVYE